jgi:N-acetylmuramoyl-L-alanine amidase
LNCPGTLIECGFLTSETEARKVGTPAYRQKLADTIAAGIRDYADVLRGLNPKTSSKTSATPVASSR